MEGKYHPQQFGPEEKQWVMKTVSLLLRMCRPMFGSNKYVVLDSLFYVAKDIEEIKAKGVYVAVFIKKRRYWPKLVSGDLIYTHFDSS